jgi:hypothetical protein
MRRWELLLWCLASLALTAYQLGRTSGPRLSYDSYQYLNIAHHLASEGSAETSIIHFDEERAHGRVPAPVSHFPIGYPVLLAGLHLLGLRLETAALAVSIAATVGVVLLLAALARRLGLEAWATRAALILWSANSQVPEFSVSALTEPLFALVSLSAIALLVSGETSSRGSGIFAGCVLAGAAYWVRYAGVLLVITVCLYGAFRCLRNQQCKAWLAGLMTTGAIVGAGMLRSFIQTGAWQGGDKRDSFHPLGGVLRTFLRAIYHLFLGDGALFVPALLLLGVGLLAAGLLMVASRSSLLPRNAGLPAPLWFYGVVYTAGMIYLGIVSTISFGARMFFPLLPILVLSIAAWAASAMHGLVVGGARWRALAAAFALAAGGYVLLNARSLARPLPPAPHQEMARWLNRPVQDGPTLRNWMERHILPGQTIVATEGQAFAYLTNRPVVSLVNSAFSSQVWDESAVHELLRRYEAPYLVVFAGVSADYTPVQSQSPFLAVLSRAVAPDTPEWLNLVADNGPVRVFHCPSCARTKSLPPQSKTP